MTEDVSLHSERLGTRDDFHSYETGRGVPGADYELAFVSGKRPGRHTIRVTVEESAGEGSGLLQVAAVTIHLTLEAPSSEAQSDLLYLDLTAGGERGDADAETLLVTSESGVFEVTSIVDTPHTLYYSVFVPPRAPVRRTVTITLTENYSVAAARDNAPTSTVVVRQTGEGGYDDRVSLALTGPHFRSRSTPGLYRAGLRIEETGAGLPPGGMLVDEAIIDRPQRHHRQCSCRSMQVASQMWTQHVVVLAGTVAGTHRCAPHGCDDRRGLQVRSLTLLVAPASDHVQQPRRILTLREIDDRDDRLFDLVLPEIAHDADHRDLPLYTRNPRDLMGLERLIVARRV